MADLRFTNVYKMLKDYNFAREDAISSDILCTICNKILINAHSAPCGCRYCLECITAYLDGEDKCCPGNTDDCKIDLLNINNDILFDQPMNIKISRLLVKCPEGQCDEKVDLSKLEDHIRVCNWRPTDCPFFNVGCRNVQMANDKLEQHILSENLTHMKLLMDCIDILRNDFGEMKEEMREDMRDMREEVRDMREEVREMKANIKEIKLEVNDMKYIEDEVKREVKEMIDKMKEIKEEETNIKNIKEEVKEIEQVKMEVREMNNETQRKLRELKEEVKEMRKMKTKVSEIKEEMKETREKIKRKQIAIDNFRAEVEDKINSFGAKIECYEEADLEMRNNGDSQMCEMTEKMNEKLEQMELKEGNINVKIGGLEERVIAIAEQQNKLNYGEFVWPIDNFADKRQRAQNDIERKIFSEAFFSHKNGYKMCLCVWPDGNGRGTSTHLSVYIHLMRGPFDDILQWPCKCDVTISLINQQSRLNHISKTFKYDESQNKSYWEQPIAQRNKGTGYPQFIKLDDLMRNMSLYWYNQIFIKCTVQIS